MPPRINQGQTKEVTRLSAIVVHNRKKEGNPTIKTPKLIRIPLSIKQAIAKTNIPLADAEFPLRKALTKLNPQVIHGITNFSNIVDITDYTLTIIYKNPDFIKCTTVIITTRTSEIPTVVILNHEEIFDLRERFV